MGIPDIRMLISVEFEVFGHVQGCYFTKYTRDLCTKAGIKGWVKNSKQGTIIGKIQGPKEEVNRMIDQVYFKHGRRTPTQKEEPREGTENTPFWFNQGHFLGARGGRHCKWEFCIKN
ncbi:acylphosphatase-2 isoform X1 [Bactrocera tryoni]|nr:acylphosphatase-2 isoform X1 [Bactrocera tryoni]